MSNPLPMNCLVTVASENVLSELRLFIKSVRLFVCKDVPIIVAGDSVIRKAMAEEHQVETIALARSFDLGIVGHEKSAVMKHGIGVHGPVLYCD